MSDSHGATVHAVVARGEGQAYASNIAVRHGISSQHLWTAQHTVDLCRQREVEIIGKRMLDMTHRSYAIGAVMASVAFLEAFINEVVGDCVET